MDFSISGLHDYILSAKRSLKSSVNNCLHQCCQCMLNDMSPSPTVFQLSGGCHLWPFWVEKDIKPNLLINMSADCIVLCVTIASADKKKIIWKKKFCWLDNRIDMIIKTFGRVNVYFCQHHCFSVVVCLFFSWYLSIVVLSVHKHLLFLSLEVLLPGAKSRVLFYRRPILALGIDCHLCVPPSVCQSWVCPHDNLWSFKARITKFGPKVQNTLLKILSVLFWGQLTLTFKFAWKTLNPARVPF